ncbi:MAG: universal stress protein [Burkholderiales bacterium]
MTLPFSRILLATEHTEFDVGAEAAAFALAAQPGVTASAVVPLVSNVEYETVAPELAAKAEAEAFARSLAVHEAAAAAGVTIEARVRRADEGWRAIVGEASDVAADFLVVRRRGRRGFLANFMVGEMVDRVAISAPCHVLIVPRKATLPRTHVLAGIDLSRAGPAVARLAARVAHVAALPLTLVGVAAQAGERDAVVRALDSAAEAARDAGAAPTIEVHEGRAAETVAARATALGADLVVAGRGGFETHGLRLKLGSNAYRIVGLLPCAVLVVRP